MMLDGNYLADEALGMERLKGIIMIISGGLLWGTTGPLLEWILDTKSISDRISI